MHVYAYICITWLATNANDCSADRGDGADNPRRTDPQIIIIINITYLFSVFRFVSFLLQRMCFFVG